MVNTTNKPLKQVRVEVHLANGEELGPTTPVNLQPGERMDLSLMANKEDFDGWTAHPVVGGTEGSEHSDGEDEHGEAGESGHSEGDSD